MFALRIQEMPVERSITGRHSCDDSGQVPGCQVRRHDDRPLCYNGLLHRPRGAGQLGHSGQARRQRNQAQQVVHLCALHHTHPRDSRGGFSTLLDILDNLLTRSLVYKGWLKGMKTSLSPLCFELKQIRDHIII